MYQNSQTLKLTWRVLVANSTPMVDLDSKQNSLRVNLESILDFPTPESPSTRSWTGNRTRDPPYTPLLLLSITPQTYPISPNHQSLGSNPENAHKTKTKTQINQEKCLPFLQKLGKSNAQRRVVSILSLFFSIYFAVEMKPKHSIQKIPTKHKPKPRKTQKTVGFFLENLGNQMPKEGLFLYFHCSLVFFLQTKGNKNIQSRKCTQNRNQNKKDP